jgi:non-specific protein-tyrosine kinase
MTPNQTPARPTPTPPRPGANAAPAGGAFTIDPVKLLLKYKWLLAGAAGLGLVLGTISHFVLLRVYPVFTSDVIFECLPPDIKPGQIMPPTIDREEIQLFMGTQVDRMKSDFVLASVVRDPRLPAEAPKWTRPYQKGTGFDLVNAQEDLEKIVRASMVPNTYFIRMAVSTNFREDAAGIVRLVKENYMDDLRKRSTSDINDRKDVTRRSIQASERQLSDLNARRMRLVRDQRLDTLDGQKSQVAESLRITNYELLKVEQALESARVGLARDEAQLQRGTGIQYDNSLRLEVEGSQQMLQLQSQLNLLESRLSSLRADGVMPQHREFRTTQSEIDGTRQQIELTRERLLREAFESRVDSYRLYIQQLQAQQSDLLRQIEELGTEMVQLTSIVGEVSDIDRSIETTIAMIAEQQMALSELDAAASLTSAIRVRVVQGETVPDVPTFPKIYIMVPLGIILLTGLVTGVVLVIELLDQRVKGPSDLAALGRMSVLGIVPDAAEDPSDPKHPESVFRDVPGSVMAEHYRQIRTRVSKAMIRQGHRTLVVVGATPGSGATSVVSNLGSALVAAGHTVLVIDANYRRPRLHLAFDAPEGPGLADVLAGVTPLDTAIVRNKSEGSGPDLLPVGSAKHRMIEQLGTQGIERVLDEARAKYEFVLLDVAPALVAGDAQTLANRCDASMLVARAMHEKRGMVVRLRNELSESRAEFLGAMVNAVRSSAGGYMRKNIRTQANYASDPSGQAA